MKFLRGCGPGKRTDQPERRFAAEPLADVPGAKREELGAEDACGEVRPDLVPAEQPPLRLRIKLAMFALRRFHDPMLAAAELVPLSRHGVYLKAKDAAFFNRCNLHDFYTAALRYLDDFERGRESGDLRSFSEYFVKVERFERLYSPHGMKPADEARVMRDRAIYLRRLNERVNDAVEAGRIDRDDLDAMTDRSRRIFEPLTTS